MRIKKGLQRPLFVFGRRTLKAFAKKFLKRARRHALSLTNGERHIQAFDLSEGIVAGATARVWKLMCFIVG